VETRKNAGRCLGCGKADGCSRCLPPWGGFFLSPSQRHDHRSFKAVRVAQTLCDRGKVPDTKSV
jgi:hypothetical protein